MLLKQGVLKGIVEGRITIAFRRWKRPTVKQGGSLRTAIGVLAIDAVDIVDETSISKRDAQQAGYASKAELLDELNTRRSGEVYRIALRYSGADPRLELRKQSKLSDDEFDDLTKRLARMDARSSCGSWTVTTLELIAANPGTRAAELAASAGMETQRFKTNVRKLKELGLSESLEVGYRLSARGKTVFKRLRT